MTRRNFSTILFYVKDNNMAALLPHGCVPMEVVFSFDTTGSMISCLGEVRGRLQEMVQRLQADIPGIRIAIFAHGDYCDRFNYVTKYVDFTDNVADLCEFVKNVGITAGGDDDECYELVLYEVRTKLSWSPGSQRVLVLIGDANPHEPNYPQNDKKLNWRKEADELNNESVKIYAVHCMSYTDGEFYKTISERTSGRYLQLIEFQNIFDLIMAVCYKEKGQEFLSMYEREVRERNTVTGMHQDLDQLFINLQSGLKVVSKETPEMLVAPKHSLNKTLHNSSVQHNIGSTLCLAKKQTREAKCGREPAPCQKKKLAKSLLPKKTDSTLYKVEKPKRGAKRAERHYRKNDTKNDTKNNRKANPHLKRENVPETNFRLKDLSWSPWQLAITPHPESSAARWRKRSRNRTGYRKRQLFGGKMEVPAFYEVAVQTKFRSKRFIVFNKFVTSGSNWERSLLGRADIKAQIDDVLRKNCKVYIRRVVLKRNYFQRRLFVDIQNYDYAWNKIPGVRSGHRMVTKASVRISDETL